MMKAIAVVMIAGLIAYSGPAYGQDPDSLKVLVIEGDGPLNNVKTGQGRRPVVEVRDEENQPVSGAQVVFSLPAYGAGGNFVAGGGSATVVTDNRGQATMPEFRPNNVEGRFEIGVAASYGQRHGAARIVQTTSVAGGSNAPAVGYVLQADDEIAVHSLLAKEISDKTYRLGPNGEVNFPLAGVLQLSGHSVREAEQILATALKRYYLEPDVSINVATFHIESVSVLGAVGTPGVHQIKGQTTLLEALSAAGGVRGDAGPVVLLTRHKTWGPIPHRDAHQIASGDNVVQIDLKSLLDSRKPADNIVVKPHDVISVPLAELVYVVGNVKKAGGFPLGGKPALSVLQALALAEGLDPSAAPGRSRILRPGPVTSEQIPIDLKKILQGKAENVVLRPNDILFVPSNAMKSISTRTIEAAIQIGTGIAIFRP